MTWLCLVEDECMTKALPYRSAHRLRGGDRERDSAGLGMVGRARDPCHNKKHTEEYEQQAAHMAWADTAPASTDL